MPGLPVRAVTTDIELSAPPSVQQFRGGWQQRRGSADFGKEIFVRLSIGLWTGFVWRRQRPAQNGTDRRGEGKLRRSRRYGWRSLERHALAGDLRDWRRDWTKM